MQRIFVGDVQGCADELDELLARAAARFGERFELWLVGDLVNRGPRSLDVLRRVRGLCERRRARMVLGNHELALLEVWFGLRPPAPNDSFHDVLEAPDASDWIEWIRRWPLVECERLGSREFVMVHAAVPPGWGLETLRERAARIHGRLARDPDDAVRLLSAGPGEPDRELLEQVTHCRSVDASGRWSNQLPERPEDAWHRRWAQAPGDYGVVYGHWSLQGLHVAPRLRGLDTGCVHHGRGRDGYLTAWLPEASLPDCFSVPDERFWQVPARRRYWPFGRTG